MMTTVQAQAHAKFEAMVAAGKHKAHAGIVALAKEWKLRHDFIAKPSAIDVGFVEKKDAASEMTIEVSGHGTFNLTHHARNQFLSHAEVPIAFADTLGEHGLSDLLRENVRRLLAKTAPTGLLIREVEGTAKGILSSAYRRLDASPMFESFVAASLKQGLVPHDGLITDTRAFVSFLRPEVTEILPGEHVVFAVELRNSDYGNGALDLSLAIWRLLCQNGAIGTSMFRKVHLGRRFDGDLGDGAIKLSTRTENLDLATMQSAMNDAVKALPAYVAAQTDALRATATKEMNLSAALAKLTKAGLRKATVEKVKDAYESRVMSVEMLPEAPGAWRFSNVLSLLANDPNLPGDEAHDLREIAGSFILPAKAA